MFAVMVRYQPGTDIACWLTGVQLLWSSDTVSWTHDSHHQAVAWPGDRAMHEHKVFEVQWRHCPSWACPSSQTLATTQLIYHVRDKTQSDGQKLADQAGATTHWLRHTFGATAVACGVLFDVVQQQLGHADISTTMYIYSRAPLKRRADELSKAFR